VNMLEKLSLLYPRKTIWKNCWNFNPDRFTCLIQSLL